MKDSLLILAVASLFIIFLAGCTGSQPENPQAPAVPPVSQPSAPTSNNAANAPAAVFNNVSLSGVGASITTEIYWSNFSGSYQLAWSVPKDSQPTVRDDTGYLESARIEDKISVTVNPSANRIGKSKSVVITYHTSADLNLNYTPLYRQRLYFDAPNNVPSLTIIGYPGFLIASRPTGFSRSFSEGEFRLLGNGSAQVDVAYGMGVKSYKHYVSFSSDIDLSEADKAFDKLPLIYGVRTDLPQIAVVVFDDGTFDRVIGPANAQSQSPGVLVFKRSRTTRVEMTGEIMHETSHIYQGALMSYNAPKISWYLEGLSEYTERVTRKAFGYPNEEVFGNAVTITESKYPNYFARRRVLGTWDAAPGKGPNVIFSSAGSSDDLWNYYANGQDYMPPWVGSENNGFGYPFAIFAVGSIIKENGIDSFRNALVALSEKRGRIGTQEEHSAFLLSTFGTDLQPCKPKNGESRDDFERCIAEVNAILQDPPLSTLPVIDLPPESTAYVRPEPAH